MRKFLLCISALGIMCLISAVRGQQNYHDPNESQKDDDKKPTIESKQPVGLAESLKESDVTAQEGLPVSERLSSSRTDEHYRALAEEGHTFRKTLDHKRKKQLERRRLQLPSNARYRIDEL